MELLHTFTAAPLDFLTTYLLPFVVVLSVLVFVHEWGHYIVARKYGVKVDVFSIGFGRELFGHTDRNGTRWKVSLIPLGGYVQMYGDSDPASARHSDDAAGGRPMTEEERKVAFFAKPVGQRAAIVFAGPAINFIFAVVILFGLFMVQGQPIVPPVAAGLVEGSPAERAGIRLDDKIIAMDGKMIETFQEMSLYTSVHLDQEIELTVLRADGQGGWLPVPETLRATPDRVEQEDRFGFKSQRGRLGIVGPKDPLEVKSHTVGSALIAANKAVWDISSNTLKALGQMVTGTRSADELGGILRIGAYAGDFAQQGVASLVMFAALLSVNLGLINLLPIPMLDGGHLAFYAMETVKGKPAGERFQEYALRVGLAFLVGIMLFATWNDLVQLKVIDYVKTLIS